MNGSLRKQYEKQKNVKQRHDYQLSYFLFVIVTKLSICIYIEFLYCTCNTNETKIFIIEAWLMYTRPTV
jgi:hypothetical protein